MAAEQSMVPVTILTGFLGSGKTTLLNQLVRQPAMRGALVVTDESAAIEPAVVESSGGRLCRTRCGTLGDTLHEAIEPGGGEGSWPFSRVIIETAGLADPAPILQTLTGDPRLVGRFRMDGLVCLVDAASGLSTLRAHRESVRQVAMADRLLISKTDLVDEEDFSRLSHRLARLNPAAEQIQVANGRLEASLVRGTDAMSRREVGQR